MIRWGPILVALVLLTACSKRQPASVVDRSSHNKRSVIITRASGAEKPPAQITVRKGDTLYSIGFRHQLDYRRIAQLNGIPKPYTIYPGQRLKLTGELPPAATRASKTQSSERGDVQTRPYQSNPSITVKSTSTQKPPQQNPQKTPTQKPVAKTDQPAENPQRTPPKTVVNPTLPDSSERTLKWQWPIRGKLLSTFLPSNPARKGISIDGKEGSSIGAAEAGVVVYSGNGLLGYGELIIIKHNDAYLSAYGHNKVRLVQEGESVKKGQTIAELGSTGTNFNNLHFEIRKNGQPVNPLNHLPK